VVCGNVAILFSYSNIAKELRLVGSYTTLPGE